jgi:serine O-acetyltransferase
MHDQKIADKLYYLNRILHSFECSYETKLPGIFLLLHVGGTVLGKGATYSDFLVVNQRCLVGAHHNIYPKLGRGVAMLPNSSIIGKCIIGDKVSIGINATIYQKDVPNNSTVYVDDSSGKICFKTNQNKPAWVQQLYNVTV